MCCEEKPVANELAERTRVVAEALSWQGTPFQWEAAIKGVGVDCGRYLAAVFNAAGVKHIDIGKFPRMDATWFMHRETGAYLETLKLYAAEYEPTAQHPPQPGDIVLARMGRDWAHGAIVIRWPAVIGAAAGFCVTRWQSIYSSPQYMNRKLKFLNPWAWAA